MSGAIRGQATLLRDACELVERIGRAVVARRRRAPPRVTRKAIGDYVTDVDHEAEHALRDALRRRHPDHNVLGEEGGLTDRGGALTWIIDPIDGTSNFLAGLPLYAVAVACVDERLDPVVAATFNLPERALFAATRGGGAQRDGVPLRCPRARLDASAIVGVQWIRGRTDLRVLRGLLATGCRIRNMGCTVAQICAVATGALQGNVQEQGRIWDLAAPGLVAQEAGARVLTWRGGELFPFPDLSGERHYASIVCPGALSPAFVRAMRRRSARG